MKRKTLILIAVLAVFIFAFAACNTESYPFEALKDTEGEVISWGTTFVEKGNYFYFVNGIQVPDEDDDNKWGEDRWGMLVRVKIDELGEENAVIETVVPKIIYTQNGGTFGFRIIDGRIYYGTPNSEKDANGAIQRAKTDIMSVKVDGTDTKRLHTFDSAEIAFMISVKGSNVYITYVNADRELRVVDVNKAKDKDTLVSEHVDEGYIFSRDNQEVFYTVTPIKEKEKEEDPDEPYKYNILYKFVAGSDPVEIRNGKKNSETDPADFEKLTIVKAKDGVVWFTLVDGRISQSAGGLWKAKTAEDAMKISATPYTSFYAYTEGGKDVFITLDPETRNVLKVTFASDGTGKFADGIEPITLAKEVSEGATFMYLSKTGKYVYYSLGNEVYRLDLSEIKDNWGLQNPVLITEGVSNSAGIAPIVLVERTADEIWVIYNTDGIKATEDYTKEYFYKSTYDNDDKSITTVVISRLFEEEDN